MSSIVTRFAPSPTGMLHIGGVRTALINWLFARHHGGQYLVRIEDTDRKRSTPEAVKAIEDGLEWLGLGSDQDIAYQSTRQARHRAVAEQLVQQGKAYYCQCSTEELTEMRTTARAEGRTRVYDRRCRDADIATEAETVVRLKVPTTGETTIDDWVQGSISMQNDHLDDYILLRADGTPTYMLSCVVDDADMNISHIIRGDDHINNAFRQIQLIRAAGFPEPAYGHIPLLHGDDGAKLSKRHGALGVDHYRTEGYLPEALLNYLMRLGWGKGEEILPLAQAAEIFALSDMSKAAARVDFARLKYFNASYLRNMSNEKAVAHLAAYRDCVFSSPEQEILLRGLNSLTQRTETLEELSNAANIYLYPPIWPLVDQKAAKQFAAKASDAGLQDIHRLAGSWAFDSAESLKEAVAGYVTERNIGFGKVGQPLRIALCGTMQAPDIGEILYALGADETKNRLAHAIENIEN